MKAVSSIVVVILLVFIAQALGQQPHSMFTERPCKQTVISGTVTDRNGAVVPGVNVALLSNGQQIRSMLSGPDGTYRFVVERGHFSVRISNPYSGEPQFSEEKSVNCGAGSAQIFWNFTIGPRPAGTPPPHTSNSNTSTSNSAVNTDTRPPISFQTPSASPLVQPSATPVITISESPTPAATDKWEAFRSNLEAQLRGGGRLIFNPPESMTQGSNATVTARISPEDVGEALRKGLPGPTGTVSEIDVAPVMKVILFSDDGAFSITSASSEEQIIRKPFTEWQWYVQALKSGNHTLRLKVIASIKTDDRGEKAMDITVYDKPVSVDISYKYLIGSFVGDSANWKYLIGSTSLITILGLVGGWVRKKLKKSAPATSEGGADGT